MYCIRSLGNVAPYWKSGEFAWTSLLLRTSGPASPSGNLFRIQGRPSFSISLSSSPVSKLSAPTLEASFLGTIPTLTSLRLVDKKDKSVDGFINDQLDSYRITNPCLWLRPCLGLVHREGNTDSVVGATTDIFYRFQRTQDHYQDYVKT